MDTGNPGVRLGAKDRLAMTPVQELTDEQFQDHALAILERELGLDGLARFLRVYRSGKGDYTADRHKWLAGITVADIAREVNSRD